MPMPMPMQHHPPSGPSAAGKGNLIISRWRQRSRRNDNDNVPILAHATQLDDAVQETHGPTTKSRKTCCLRWLLSCLVSAAIIGTTLRHSILGIRNHDGNAAIATKSKRAPVIVRLQVAVNDTLEERSTGTKSAAGTSFFDCNNARSKCRYFYPGEFFQQYFAAAMGNASINIINGSIVMHKEGYNIASSEQQEQYYIQWRKHIGLENPNLPALDSLSWWVKGESQISSDQALQNHLNLPHNITYIHVHKCGGTSIQGALYRRARHIRNTHFQMILNDDNATDVPNQEQLLPVRAQANVHTYKHSFGGGSKERKRQHDEERLDHIRAIADVQQGRSNDDTASAAASFPIFTVVRDPIQRFLSAVQQVMHYNTEFREKCLRENDNNESLALVASFVSSTQNREEREAMLRHRTIQCAIRDMEETTFRRDVHLLPMASHFRLLSNVTSADDSKDIAVSVFYMNDIEDLLLHLGNKGKDENENNAGNGDTSNKKPTTIHARDRSNVEYATSSILARLSPDDCDEEMISQICRLYHVDVELLKWLGFGGDAAKLCRE